MSAKDRARFDALRAKYLAAKKRCDDLDIALAVKFGRSYERSWLKAGDRKALERAQAARDKAGDALFDHVQSFSPRDWSCGVPADWVRESLTYEDAARPAGEALSVTPPLAYGVTAAMT